MIYSNKQERSKEKNLLGITISMQQSKERQTTKEKVIRLVIVYVAITLAIIGASLATIEEVRVERGDIEAHNATMQIFRKIDRVNKAIDERDQTTGVASWYRYSVGEWTNEDKFVCAVREVDGRHPRGEWVKVIYKGVSVECQVTDYGPDASVHPDRVVDLSPVAFRALATSELDAGLIGPVRVVLVK